MAAVAFVAHVVDGEVDDHVILARWLPCGVEVADAKTVAADAVGAVHVTAPLGKAAAPAQRQVGLGDFVVQARGPLTALRCGHGHAVVVCAREFGRAVDHAHACGEFARAVARAQVIATVFQIAAVAHQAPAAIARAIAAPRARPAVGAESGKLLYTVDFLDEVTGLHTPVVVVEVQAELGVAGAVGLEIGCVAQVTAGQERLVKTRTARGAVVA